MPRELAALEQPAPADGAYNQSKGVTYMDKQLRNMSFRIPDKLRREFYKKLLDDTRYGSAQDFLLTKVKEYLKEGKGNGEIHNNS